MITEILVPLAVIAAAFMGINFYAAARFNKLEYIYIMLGFAFHTLASFAQVLITKYYYGGGDMFLYYRTAVYLSDALIHDFGFWAPHILDLTLGEKPMYLPVHVIGVGRTTGSMSGLMAWLMLPLGGSLYGACLTVGYFAFLGKVTIYQVMAEIAPPEYKKRLLIACLFIPSVVFWSSSILKETVAIGGLGVTFLGIRRLFFTKRLFIGVALIAFGGTITGIIKPYILFPLAMATGVWLYWQSMSRRRGRGNPFLRLFYLSIALAVGAGGVVALGELFPRYSIDNITEETAHSQRMYEKVSGKSTIRLGGGEATGARQLLYAPLALIAVLFRPVIFEAHNITSMINALEMLIISLLIIRLFRQVNLGPIYRSVIRSPFLMFCVTFVLIFGVAVGLGAPNLGSLSRYRIPIMPFYVALILLLLPLRRRDPSAK